MRTLDDFIELLDGDNITANWMYTRLTSDYDYRNVKRKVLVGRIMEYVDPELYYRIVKLIGPDLVRIFRDIHILMLTKVIPFISRMISN